MQGGEVKACIQPLNQGLLKQGSFDNPPFVYHLGDDRTGANAAGENMKINMAHLRDLVHVYVFTYIYEGAPDWAATDAVVTVKVPGQPVLEVPMGQERSPKGFCCICKLEFQGRDGKDIRVTKLVSFHDGHPDCDRRYGWGLKWVAGSKD